MNNRGNRRGDNPLSTYLFVGAVMGAICGGLLGLWLYDSATALFHWGLAGLSAGAAIFALLSADR